MPIPLSTLPFAGIPPNTTRSCQKWLWGIDCSHKITDRKGEVCGIPMRQPATPSLCRTRPGPYWFPFSKELIYFRVFLVGSSLTSEVRGKLFAKCPFKIRVRTTQPPLHALPPPQTTKHETSLLSSDPLPKASLLAGRFAGDHQEMIRFGSFWVRPPEAFRHGLAPEVLAARRQFARGRRRRAPHGKEISRWAASKKWDASGKDMENPAMQSASAKKRDRFR